MIRKYVKLNMILLALLRELCLIKVFNLLKIFPKKILKLTKAVGNVQVLQHVNNAKIIAVILRKNSLIFVKALMETRNAQNLIVLFQKVKEYNVLSLNSWPSKFLCYSGYHWN